MTEIVITEQFSVGAFADSAHEYLLKQWLLTGRSEPDTRDLCKSSLLDNIITLYHSNYIQLTRP